MRDGLGHGGVGLGGEPGVNLGWSVCRRVFLAHLRYALGCSVVHMVFVLLVIGFDGLELYGLVKAFLWLFN